MNFVEDLYRRCQLVDADTRQLLTRFTGLEGRIAALENRVSEAIAAIERIAAQQLTVEKGGLVKPAPKKEKDGDK